MAEYGRQHLYNHGNGSYFNEPDYLQENWKEEFWGRSSNYDRLLEVKRRWDPSSLFRCHHCVGSSGAALIKSAGLSVLVLMATVAMATTRITR